MTTTETGEEIAKTIIQQLAGHSNRLKIMTGAYNLMYSSKENYFSFRFKMCSKINYCKITLNSLDLYDMEFGKIHGMKYKVVEEISNVYDDSLKPIFERITGLYLPL